MSVLLSVVKDEWFKTKGEGVVFGVCDGGIDSDLSSFRPSLAEYRYFGERPSLSTRHGNHVCGLIFGSSDRRGTYTGLCPRSRTYVAGMGLKGDVGSLLSCLQWLSQFKIDILNLSLALKEDFIELRDILLRFHDSGTWIFSSHSSEALFPWSYDFVNSVSYSASSGADIISIGEGFSSGDGFSISQMFGSSVSCAFVSGVAGLFRSYSKLSIDDFKSEINGSTLYIPLLNESRKVKLYIKGE